MTIIALYVRLSVNEKGERDESLETQCSLLEHLAGERGAGDYKLYVDDDISGTTFERPGLVEMRRDIEEGLINEVWVKDLSRLGRNNGETLLFLDYLAEKGVRLLAAVDNYDSFRDDDDTIGIRTWVNEHYARDISKKVRANLKEKKQKGEFLGSPPFGYQKSGREKNKLVVDERYRNIIKKIFELYIEGRGYRSIALYIQKTGIPTPGEEKGGARDSRQGRWNEQHIRRIISNRVYCGDSVQGVSKKISFKSKKTKRLPETEWIVVSGTHEAIIDRDTWELAKKVRLSRYRGSGRKKSTASRPHLFSGFLVCAGCGAHLVYRKKSGRQAGYICGSYNRHGCGVCSSHYIPEAKLLRCIVQDLEDMAESISWTEVLKKKYGREGASGDIIKKKIDKLEHEINSRQKQHQAAYIDRLRGIIDEDLFLSTGGVLAREIRLLTDQLNDLLKESPFEFKEVEKYIKTSPVGFNTCDISRSFLEEYIYKIIVLDENKRINDKVIEEYNLKMYFDSLYLREKAAGRIKFIILYNLSPLQ